MIVWFLLFLLGPEHRPLAPDGYYLTARECERVQAQQKRPEQWECLPGTLDRR